MSKLITTLLGISFCMFPLWGHAKLKVITTTTNLKSLVAEIGGEKVDVSSFCKGSQDPHYLEAKPSYMFKASKADLLVSIGLGLEEGWLPLIIRGARNPKIRDGARGSLVTGNFIETIGKIEGKVSRSHGDVHPEGNPHFLLDPVLAIQVAEKIKDKLSELDSEQKSDYERRFKSFKKKMNSLVLSWEKKLKSPTKVITYHKTLNYFFRRFKTDLAGFLEPKPGIPPTASHILSMIKKAKKEKVKLILVENYFDPTVAQRVSRDVKGVKVRLVPVAVDGKKGIESLFDLYKNLVQAVSEG